MEEKKEMKRGSVSSPKTGSRSTVSKKQTKWQKIWHYLWMFRGAIMSLPVLVFAIVQAFRNATILPETVGLNLLATGEFAKTVPRASAVVLPLLITIVCILLTCFTKRPLFPWLISIFTLVIPVLIWVINIYPA